KVSKIRIQVQNLPHNVTKANIEAHFTLSGIGRVTETRFQDGVRFIEYNNWTDAGD
ncbi:hypothetical protein F5883DRAFT_367344, partial [Diaporthe sp. PMI_573]